MLVVVKVVTVAYVHVDMVVDFLSVVLIVVAVVRVAIVVVLNVVVVIVVVVGRLGGQRSGWSTWRLFIVVVWVLLRWS